MLFTGNPLIDCHVTCPADALSPLGFEPFGVYHTGSETVEPLNQAFNPQRISAAGGAFTAAVTAASLGAPAAFIGCVGTDSALHAEACSRAGVNNLMTLSPETGTGSCWYFHHPGGRQTVITSPGAALCLSGDDIRRIPEQTDIGNRRLYIEGFLLPREGLVEALLELIRSSDLVPVVDPGSPGIAAAFGSRIMAIMNAASGKGMTPWMIATADEIAELFQRPWQDAAAGAAQRGWETVVKLSDRGCAAFEAAAGSGLTIIPPEVVLPGNPVGAGDIFAGAYIAARLSGLSSAEAALYAGRTAGEILARRIVPR